MDTSCGSPGAEELFTALFSQLHFQPAAFGKAPSQAAITLLFSECHGNSWGCTNFRWPIIKSERKEKQRFAESLALRLQPAGARPSSEKHVGLCQGNFARTLWPHLTIATPKRMLFLAMAALPLLTEKLTDNFWPSVSFTDRAPKIRSLRKTFADP